MFFARFLKPVFGFKLIYDMHSSLPEQLTNYQLHHLARADRRLRVAGADLPQGRRRGHHHLPGACRLCRAADARPVAAPPDRELDLRPGAPRPCARGRAAGRQTGRAARGPADRRLRRHVRGLPGPRHADRGLRRGARSAARRRSCCWSAAAPSRSRSTAAWPPRRGIGADERRLHRPRRPGHRQGLHGPRRDPDLAAQHRHQHAAQDLRAAGERHAARGDAHPVAHPGARRRGLLHGRADGGVHGRGPRRGADRRGTARAR